MLNIQTPRSLFVESLKMLKRVRRPSRRRTGRVSLTRSLIFFTSPTPPTARAAGSRRWQGDNLRGYHCQRACEALDPSSIVIMAALDFCHTPGEFPAGFNSFNTSHGGF